MLFLAEHACNGRELGILSCFEADGRKSSHCLQTVNTFEDVHFPELNGVDTGRLLGMAHGTRGTKL